MKLEALTVCVGYADFLAETAAFNRKHFDRWIIVTDRKDQETVDVCHRLNLEVLRTDEFTRNGDPFNKGRAIDRGLAMLTHADWLLHLDADIALPTDFRESLHDADLDPECIYGVDRQMLVGWDQWQAWKTRGSTRAFHCYQRTHIYPIGARWCDVRYGYVPIGFFQLWHQSADVAKGIRLNRYPDGHSDAARADVKFALQWDRRRRQLIPEVVVAHLESESGPTGVNWSGRKTRRFEPPGGSPKGPGTASNSGKSYSP
jgi:hypothetical protein